MRGLVAEIALDGATSVYDKLYTYAISPELHSKAKPGCRALVPFGRSNQKKQGMIFSVKDSEISGLKNLICVIDDEPVLSEEMLKMCEYMKETVFCTYYDAVGVMLPAGLGYKLINYYSANLELELFSQLEKDEQEIYEFLKEDGEKEESVIINRFGVTAEKLSLMVQKHILVQSKDAKRKIGDAKQRWARLSPDFDIENTKLTLKQTNVVNLLRDAGAASVKEICYYTGVTVSVVEGLIKKGILIAFDKEIFRTFHKSAAYKKEDIILTEEQNVAFNGLLSEYKDTNAKVSLLYGVTGSGKTQVFLRLVDKVYRDGKGIIVMVPEISLTPQLISIFGSRYGEKIAVFHSAMSLGQRLDEWKRVKEGKALIAIGTRSAVFAPFKDLGLIIIDEEHEHTYKSEKSPRFNARDLAKFRTKFHNGLLCLASATPSIESYTNALNGKYSLFTLKNRYGSAELPTVETVDMKKELLNGNTGVFSNTLYEAIKETLSQKKQAIILLNRRGHNTYVSCAECGYVASCPNCSVSLTYHSANERLMCHYCGYSQKADRVCPECSGEHLKFMGLGTQKAEEELKMLFPDARVLRLDADSTMARDSFTTYLNDFAKGEYDILLGTQMVAKGLDFKNVTLVGVLGADSAMYSEDFRSFERTFSLLTQVVGRAGRGEFQGKAIIQTANPDNSLIDLATNQDYDTFYNDEILTRKLMIYPPYCDICVVSTQSASNKSALDAINIIFKEIKKLIDTEYSGVKLIILGPSPATVTKVNNRYRFRMIIKCKNNKEFRKMLNEAIGVKLPSGASVSVDINPESVM